MLQFALRLASLLSYALIVFLASIHPSKRDPVSEAAVDGFPAGAA